MSHPDHSVRLHRIGRSVWLATLVTLLGAVTGLFGSLYSAEIRSAFPFYWRMGPLSLPATGFWCLLLATGGAYFWRQRSIDSAREAAEELLTSEAANLADLIRTMPPRDFLETFKHDYLKCDKVVFEFMRGDETRRSEEAAIGAVRLLIGAMVGLAHHYDGSPGHTYAGNVMTFLPIGGIPTPAPRELEDRARFLGGTIEQKRGELSGLLDLRTELSMRFAGRDQQDQPDPDLRPMALPVPSAHVNGARSRALPGAPDAFCFRHVSFYEDTRTMASYCETHGDFLPSVIEQLKHYFDPATSPNIRSLVSFPILSPFDDAPIGVVNIHRNAVGILRRETGAGDPGTFSVLMAPFAQLLAHLLVLSTFMPAQERE